ncbi:MAG: NOB1 family endonuclease [Candidatus Ranarchaeia archaeon]
MRKNNYVNRSDTPFFMILDTGAFISGVSQRVQGIIVTTPSVIHEVRGTRAKRGLEALKAAGRLEIVEPSKASIKEIVATIKQSGDYFVLSQTDIDVLAIANMYYRSGKKALLITDDYAIQNAAKIIKLSFVGYSQKEIRAIWDWEIYCPYCFRIYPTAHFGEQCPECRVKLKRRRKGVSTKKT